jgi:hypothetical protein
VLAVVMSLLVVGAVSASAVSTALGGSGSHAPEISLPTWGSTYAWPASDGYAGWEHRIHTADADAYRLATGLGGRPGLWLWPTGGRGYGPGGAEWVLRAPGTTRIARASL